MITKKLLDELTFQVIGAAIEVHNSLDYFINKIVAPCPLFSNNENHGLNT